MNPIEKCPETLLLKILSYDDVTIHDVCEFQKTCRKFYNLFEGDLIWREKFNRMKPLSFPVMYDLIDPHCWKQECFNVYYFEKEVEDYVFDLLPYMFTKIHLFDYHIDEINDLLDRDFKKMCYSYEFLYLKRQLCANYSHKTLNGLFVNLVMNIVKSELTKELLQIFIDKPKDKQSYEEALFIVGIAVNETPELSFGSFQYTLDDLVDQFLGLLQHDYPYYVYQDNIHPRDKVEIQNIFKYIYEIFKENFIVEDDYSSYFDIVWVIENFHGSYYCLTVLISVICNRLGISIVRISKTTLIICIEEENEYNHYRFDFIFGSELTPVNIADIADNSIRSYLVDVLLSLVESTIDDDLFPESHLTLTALEMAYFLDPKDNRVAIAYVDNAELLSYNYKKIYNIYTSLGREPTENFLQLLIDYGTKVRVSFEPKLRSETPTVVECAVGCVYKDNTEELYYLILGWYLVNPLLIGELWVPDDYTSDIYYLVYASDDSFRKVTQDKISPYPVNYDFCIKRVRHYFTEFRDGCFTLNDHLLTEFPEEEFVRNDYIQNLPNRGQLNMV